MVEKKEENALVGTAVMTGLEAGHESPPATDGTLPPQFREGNLVPDRGDGAIDVLKGQLELKGETGAAELLVRMLAQEDCDALDVACHSKFSTSRKLGVSTKVPS